MYNEENREFNINPKKEETPDGMTNENTASENTAEFTEHNENINNTEANETEKEGTKLSEEGVSKTAESEFKECNEEENKTAERKPYEPIKDCYYKETVKKPKKNGFKRLIAACAVVGLCGGIGIGSGYSVMENIVFQNNDASKASGSTNVTEEAKSNSSSSSSDIVSLSTAGNEAVAVIDSVFPSVVNINTSVHTTTNYYGIAIPYDGESAGSGVIFDEDDQYVYIVTNNHVVADSDTISVSVTGNESISAEVVGTEASSDLAVIKALKSDFEAAGVDYKIAKFGDSDQLKVGESVLAIGNALGEGKSATGGMISVINKTIEIDGVTLEVLQTSAPINPGNSGGALVNYDGEIIGINTAKTSTSVAEGMGYAIPSNTVKEVMERLLVDGTTPKPYLGIMGSDITDDISNLYKLPVGVLVVDVLDGSAAQNAGLVEGDIIVGFNGSSVMNMEGLQSILKECEIGSTVNMDIIRNGNESKTLTVTIQDANA